MVRRKLGREYTLKIEGTTGRDITVSLPYTLEIQVSRNILSSVNNGSFRVFNLKPSDREQIRKDSKEYFLSKRVELTAGYGKDRHVIFAGNVLSAYSIREGNNFITTIEAFDGGFGITNTLIKKSYGKGMSYKNIVSDMARNFSPNGIGVGSIGEIKGVTKRGSAFDGNAFENISTLSGGGVFIDNEKINVLGDNEYIDGPTILVSSRSGLLGTPKVEGARVGFSMLFEPRVKIANLVKLISTTNKNITGKDYKVLSLSHSGIFSVSVSGAMTTKIESFLGAGGLRRVF